MLTDKDKRLAERFRDKLIENDLPISRVIAFGSRSRGDADDESDFDILVVVDDLTPEIRQKIRDHAWELSLAELILIAPLIVTEDLFHSATVARLLTQGVVI